jgi:hypothetical protein
MGIATGIVTEIVTEKATEIVAEKATEKGTEIGTRIETGTGPGFFLRCLCGAGRCGPGRLVLVGLLLGLAGCVQTQTERGIPPTWRDAGAATFVRGESTEAEVLARLGPPSQVISHDGGQIFYYLHEVASTRGLILVLYNKNRTVTEYDRAIFFFDTEGRLLDFSISASDAGP